jgi:hypothetical protein
VAAVEQAAKTANGTINQNTGYPYLSDKLTADTVSFCESALAGIKAEASGWRNALGAAWNKFKSTFPLNSNNWTLNPFLLAAFAALNLLLLQYGGG